MGATVPSAPGVELAQRLHFTSEVQQQLQQRGPPTSAFGLHGCRNPSPPPSPPDSPSELVSCFQKDKPLKHSKQRERMAAAVP